MKFRDLRFCFKPPLELSSLTFRGGGEDIEVKGREELLRFRSYGIPRRIPNHCMEPLTPMRHSQRVEDLGKRQVISEGRNSLDRVHALLEACAILGDRSEPKPASDLGQ